MRWDKKILSYLLIICIVLSQVIPRVSAIAAQGFEPEAGFLAEDEAGDEVIAEDEAEEETQSYTTEYMQPSEAEQFRADDEAQFDSLEALSQVDPFWAELIEDEDSAEEVLNEDSAKEDLDEDSTEEDLDEDSTEEDLDEDNIEEDLDEEITEEDLEVEEAKDEESSDEQSNDALSNEVSESTTETLVGIKLNIEKQVIPTEIVSEKITEVVPEPAEQIETEIEEATEEITEETTEEITEETTEKIIEETTEKITEEITEKATEETTEEATEETAEEATEETTEKATEEITEEETEETTEEVTEEITEEETEDLTEEETEDLTEEETEDLTEDEKEEEIRERAIYTYEDGQVRVEAELEYPEDIPDDAQLVATRVTADTPGYNYEAYMEALNQAWSDGQAGQLIEDADQGIAQIQAAENADDGAAITDEDQIQAAEKPLLTSENTILYDIAFLAENVDPETGEPDGTMKEFEPESGSVAIRITFLKNQLKKEIGAQSADELQVVHLPLTQEVRESVSTTQEATQIAAEDILVETVSADTSMNSLDMTLDSLSVTAVISGNYEEPQPSTASGTVTNGKPISAKELMQGIGTPGQFGIFANYFHIANHIASTIAVKELSLREESGQFGLENNNAEQSRVYPDSYEVKVNKKVEGEKKDGTFRFGLFTKNGDTFRQLDTVTLTTDTSGEAEGIFIGEFDQYDELYVFELDEKGTILKDQDTFTSGITSYTVDYQKDEQQPVAVKAGGTRGSNISYVERFTGERRDSQLVNRNTADKPEVVVGSGMTVYTESDDHRPVVVGDGANVHFNMKSDEVTVTRTEGTFPIDFGGELDRLSALSGQLAQAGSSSDVDVYNVHATSEGLKIDLSTAVFNDRNKMMDKASDGISLADGRWLLINVDCTDLYPGQIYEVGQYKINGHITDGSPNDLASRVVFNYYTRNPDGSTSPYAGLMKGTGADGTHIAPRATFTEFTTFRGSIFANRIETNNGEVHHDPVIRASVKGNMDVVNTCNGQLQQIEMPETGSKGMLMCMLIGAMLMAAGVMILGASRRRRCDA